MRLYRARADQRHLCILSFLVKHPSHSCPVIPSLSYCPPAEPSLFRWFSFSQSSFTSFFFLFLCAFLTSSMQFLFIYLPSFFNYFLIILKSPLPTSLPILAVASPFLCFACSIVAGLSHLVSSLTPQLSLSLTIMVGVPKRPRLIGVKVCISSYAWARKIGVGEESSLPIEG